MLGGGPHAVDILRWITGEYDEVFAYGLVTLKNQEKEDFAVALYKSHEGRVARVVVSYGIRRPYLLSIRIYGTKASFEQDINPWSYLSGTLFMSPRREDSRRIVLREEETPIKIHGSADYLQALNFVNSIRGKEKPLVDVYEAAKTTVACIAALESMQKTSVVKIPRIE